MGRRKKADLLDAIGRIVALYEEDKKTFQEIEEILRAEGLDISYSAIRRSYQDYASLAEKYKQISEETKGLLETLKNSPTTDAMLGVQAIMINHLFQYVRSIDSIDFDNPTDLVIAINKLSSSSEKLTKYRTTQLKEAVDKVKDEGSKRNIDPEFLELMKREIYGIK